MPKGPNGQKRPADAIGLAVMVGRIATGELHETVSSESPRKRAAKAGGKARSEALTAERRSEIATKAAKDRWDHGPAVVARGYCGAD